MKIAIVLETTGDGLMFGREEFHQFGLLAWEHGHIVQIFDLGPNYVAEGCVKQKWVAEVVKDFDWCLLSLHVNPRTKAFFRDIKKGKVKIAYFSHDLMTTTYDVIGDDGKVPELMFIQTKLQMDYKTPQGYEKCKRVAIPSIKLDIYSDYRLKRYYGSGMDVAMREIRCTKGGTFKKRYDRDTKLVTIVVNFGAGAGRKHVDTRIMCEVLESAGFTVKYKGTSYPMVVEDRVTEFHGLLGVIESTAKSKFMISESSGTIVDAIYGGSIPILMVSSNDPINNPVVKVIGKEGDVDIVEHFEEAGYPRYKIVKTLPVAWVENTDKVGEPLLEKLKHLSEHYEDNVRILQDAWCIKSDIPAHQTMLKELEEYGT